MFSVVSQTTHVQAMMCSHVLRAGAIIQTILGCFRDIGQNDPIKMNIQI